MCYNFPKLEQMDVKNNVYCLYKAISEINMDPEFCQIVYKTPDIPDQRLSALVSEFFNLNLSKEEQCSVWSERPLRANQLIYASMDSLCTFLIYGLIKEKLTQAGYGEMVPKVFRNLADIPLNRIDDMDIDDPSSAPSSGRKTKAHHFTQEELLSIVKKTNAYLRAKNTETVESTKVKYAVDTMCSQLGLVLRNVGIFAQKCDGTDQNSKDILNKHLTTWRVITTGKAKKNVSSNISTIIRLLLHIY